VVPLFITLEATVVLILFDVASEAVLFIALATTVPILFVDGVLRDVARLLGATAPRDAAGVLIAALPSDDTGFVAAAVLVEAAALDDSLDDDATALEAAVLQDTAVPVLCDVGAIDTAAVAVLFDVSVPVPVLFVLLEAVTVLDPTAVPVDVAGPDTALFEMLDTATVLVLFDVSTTAPAPAPAPAVLFVMLNAAAVAVLLLFSICPLTAAADQTMASLFIIYCRSLSLNTIRAVPLGCFTSKYNIPS